MPANIRRFLQTYIIGNPRSTFYITYWSILHFLSGILFTGVYLWFRPSIATATTASFSLNKEVVLYGFVAHTLWELWQIAIGMNRPFALSGNNNLVDICVDTVLFMAGIGCALLLFRNRVQKPF